MPSRTIPLSDGREILVGPLSWRAAKQIKNALIDLLAQDAQRLLPLLDLVRSGQLPSHDALQQLGRFLVSAIDDLTEVLVRGCLGTTSDSPPVDFATLAYADVLALSTAASELNDIEQLVLAEGNAVAGRLAKSLMSRLAPATPSPTTPPTGTGSAGVSSSTLDLFDGASPPAT
ncbi:hypothetical protein [Planctomyces sp. SH-PL14]|uniref:hypothetical protein n=1 Tax=Planctomyces sp. SH-PL14 TaxID=1632864 RepID=UPI00078DF1F3|nr:hypothetical protein [Planctomyces sp. SH-PL14]AMV20576.1 hypothetical protein VT03_21940 [Planctomyces sp. SH-PL14]